MDRLMTTTLELASQAEREYLTTVQAAEERYKEFLLNSGYQILEYNTYTESYKYYVHPEYIKAARSSMCTWGVSLDDMCEFLGIEELPEGALIEAP